jgi:hypothetical protein
VLVCCRGIAFDQVSTISNNYRGSLLNAPRPKQHILNIQ